MPKDRGYKKGEYGSTHKGGEGGGIDGDGWCGPGHGSSASMGNVGKGLGACVIFTIAATALVFAALSFDRVIKLEADRAAIWVVDDAFNLAIRQNAAKRECDDKVRYFFGNVSKAINTQDSTSTIFNTSMTAAYTLILDDFNFTVTSTVNEGVELFRELIVNYTDTTYKFWDVIPTVLSADVYEDVDDIRTVVLGGKFYLIEEPKLTNVTSLQIYTTQFRCQEQAVADTYAFTDALISVYETRKVQ
jgi:hypothetical protein